MTDQSREAVITPSAGRATPLVVPFWRLLFALTVIAIALVVLHAVSNDFTRMGIAEGGYTHSLQRLVNLDTEGNLPSWYTAMLWVIAAWLGIVNGAHSKQAGRGSWHWIALTALFLLLSLDEAASLHESIGDLIAPIAPIKGGFFSWSWVFYGMALILGASVLFGKFLLTLPPKICVTLGAGAVIFVAGALGAEMFNAAATNGAITLPGNLDTGRLMVLEEFLEMLGVIVAIGGLLALLRDEIGTLIVVE